MFLAAGLAILGSFVLAGVTLASEKDSNFGMMNRGEMGNRMMSSRPVIVGTVSAVSGNTVTVTGNQGFNKNSDTTATTTYTVDATNAKVTKANVASTVSSITVGDNVVVQGTINGTNVVATIIRDGMIPNANKKNIQPVIQGNGQPIVAGKIMAINGNTITITNSSNVTYTIDATNAKFAVKGITTPTISNVAVGDNVVVQGAVNGNAVVASSVIDQKVPAVNSNANDNDNNQKMNYGFVGGIGNFFKHLFGF